MFGEALHCRLRKNSLYHPESNGGTTSSHLIFLQMLIQVKKLLPVVSRVLKTQLPFYRYTVALLRKNGFDLIID